MNKPEKKIALGKIEEAGKIFWKVADIARKEEDFKNPMVDLARGFKDILKNWGLLTCAIRFAKYKDLTKNINNNIEGVLMGKIREGEEKERNLAKATLFFLVSWQYIESFDKISDREIAIATKGSLVLLNLAVFFLEGID